MVTNKLLATGALEVLFNNGGGDAPAVVFSKLDTGRVPTLEEIWAGIDMLRPAAGG